MQHGVDWYKVSSTKLHLLRSITGNAFNLDFGEDLETSRDATVRRISGESEDVRLPDVWRKL